MSEDLASISVDVSLLSNLGQGGALVELLIVDTWQPVKHRKTILNLHTSTSKLMQDGETLPVTQLPLMLSARIS